MSPKPSLTIGVYVPADAQLLDLSGIDIFGMLSPTYLATCKLPGSLVSLGTPSKIHYIGLNSNNDNHAELTANVSIRLTNTVNDLEVQPGKLDIILVPGPDPSTIFGEEALSFLRGHSVWTGSEGEKTDILIVCTGCILAAQSGILDGKNASGPRAVVPDLRRKYSKVNWDGNQRWVVDGNIWSSGGITNGLEMIAAYLRAKLPGPATEAVLAMADVGNRGNAYKTSATTDKVWWIGQILKALVWGKAKIA